MVDFDCIDFLVDFENESEFLVQFENEDNDFAVELEPDPVIGYPGPYEVTPRDETIVLQTVGTTAAQNIIIHAIPDNYGLLTWHGSYLRIE